MENVNKLAERIRADGISSGWNPITIGEWATSDYKVPTLLALIHSEICEAYAETGSDTPDAFLASEFADILIRTLDLAGGLTTDFAFYVGNAWDAFSSKRAPLPESLFLGLNQKVTNALEAFRRDDKQQFLAALACLFVTTANAAILDYNIDIGDAIERKMAFNHGRQRRNGGKRV